MYTDVELMKILESVEKEFNTHLAKAEEKSASLAKAEDKPFPPKDEKKPEDKEEDKESEEKPMEDKKEEHKEEPKSEEDKEHSPEMKPEGQPEQHGDESHGYDDEDMEHMKKMYMSMSKAELKAHHDCIADIAKCGDGMMKSETNTVIEVKVPEINPETTLLKSELEAEKVKAADLQKKVDLATEFMAKLAAKKSAPQGKAITSLEVIAKSEETKLEKSYTQSEVNSMLNKKSMEPSLSKADREAINDYYLGSKNIKVVKHLLS